MKTKEEYNLYESIGHLVDVTSRLMNIHLNRKFNENGHDVTAFQWKILTHLWNKDGMNQQEISDRVGNNKASTTYLIDGLERRGLVERVTDEKDRRSKRIHLTSKGKKMQHAFTFLAQKNLDQAQNGINSKDLKICKDVLGKIIENMKI